ncbi:dynein regulatory complex protein 8-like [Coccinella septempunctata]|uniref:dynein regulatory complex protein 8-like n=1 Tax=Coccinella septempunctata TaxID=41139 RepID=UPI001D0674E8|nr:dynein regulatory complex protein 8-like [Coccinella septempunctata]
MNELDLSVSINSDLERRIVEAFLIFDHTGNKTVDAREISTIVRSLGCCPTEAEIQEIIVANEDQESPGNVHLSDFLPYMVQVITERRFQPASAEKLLEAFRVLDPKGKKYLTIDEISSLMTEGGEPLQPEELEEMMRVGIDPETDSFPYEVYINEIMFD